MSSTILYKFRSGTNFEALSLPGTSARLLDVKKAIVAAKKLDQGSIEFDLAVKDATTNEDYTDESMLLPRGTRVVVQRLPAAKGQGFLARVARAQMTGFAGSAASGAAASGAAPDNFYTIDGRGQDEDEEFVSSTSVEDKELAALRAATEAAGTAVIPMTMARAGMRQTAIAGSGPPPPRFNNHGAGVRQQQQRPNADPELREQEKQLMPKKRATGIPRTFLNLSAAPDGTGDGDPNVPLLQPNVSGFKELLNRGGGLSELATGGRKDLDYALKLTSTTIPEYLLCAICHSVVRDAMMLPWDTEGRTTCDFCIRDALTKSGFRCPLTGQEGVSPDDLLPNHALRKAAQSFINEVMAKIEEIEELPDDDDLVGDEHGIEGKILDGETAEKGVLVSRRTAPVRANDEGLSGGDDLGFGGDVFAAAPNEQEEEVLVPKSKSVEPVANITEPKSDEVEDASAKEALMKTAVLVEKTDSSPKNVAQPEAEPSPAASRQRSPSESTTDTNPRREPHRRRGPPVGYQMGPAGGAGMDRSVANYGNNIINHHQSPTGMGARGFDGRFNDRSYHGGRGDRGGRFGGRGRYGDFPPQHQVRLPFVVC
ncbi:hypothetical protein MPSEU_000784800 [Mayamaea pseudoterrestris]|nr:hypothetical protein MPSEU_000784800 [Mayamaea pseudoterrestris]